MSDIELPNTLYDNTVLDWITAIALIVASIAIGRAIYWLLSRGVKTFTAQKSKLGSILIDMLEEPLVLIAVLSGIWFSLQTLSQGPVARQWLSMAFNILIILNIAWLISRTKDALIEHYVVPLVAKTETQVDDVLLPTIRSTSQIIIWALAILVALSNAGYDVGALIAGLGIGGLAFAMAARDSVANIFGGLTIIMNRPFTIGDRIRTSGVDGWVIHIGLRTTTIRDFRGRAHIIPNKTFIDNFIENVDVEKKYYEVSRFRLRHDMSPEKIESAMAVLKQLVLDIELLENEYWITFDEIASYSFDIEFWYAIKKWHPYERAQFSDWYQKKSAAKTQLHLQILKQFEQNNIKLAIPVELRSVPAKGVGSIFSDEALSDKALSNKALSGKIAETG